MENRNDGYNNSAHSRQSFLNDEILILKEHGYTIGKTIGRGTSSVVKLGYSKKCECNVAVKIIRKFKMSNNYLEQFLPNELELVEFLHHKNIVKHYETLETQSYVFIITEYLQHGDLHEFVKRQGPIDEEKAKTWFLEIVDAVEYCHNFGIAHRDIKCENILIDDEYHMKLGDFGFAKGNLMGSKGKFRKCGTFCGTARYSAPEVLNGIPYHPDKADNWSLGVMLYYMLCGKFPFNGENIQTIRMKVRNSLEFPETPRLSGACKNLLRHLLAPAHVRIDISGVRNHAWCKKPN